MGVYDFLSLQNLNKNYLGGLFTGSYSVSMGDNLSAFIGSGRQTHIVGDEIKYVFDWIRCLEQIPLLKSLMGALPLNALLGEGGNMTWTFGRKTDLHYIGPAIAINRAGKKTATSRSKFYAAESMPKDFKGTAEEWEAKEKVAKWSGRIVGLLSFAMLAVNTGVQVAARVKYQSGYNKYKTTPNTSDRASFEEMTKYCSITLILTTRLMYLIKSIELCTVMAQNAVSQFYSGLRLLTDSTTGAICASVSLAVFVDIAERLSKAKESATKFAIEMALLVVALALITVLVLVGIGIAATVS
ncbi:MAG: hypothetical protein K8U57_11690 [Planctomycetes bacterium]|nr:hypothetical protein [Planctomycetota bacterium]